MFGYIWLVIDRYEKVWTALESPGQLFKFLTGLDKSGPIKTGLNIFVQVRTGLDTSGQGWIVPHRSGKVWIFWTGLNMSGKFWTGLNTFEQVSTGLFMNRKFLTGLHIPKQVRPGDDSLDALPLYK